MSDYDYYTMKIPKKLKNFFEKYLRKHPDLGFNLVSQFIHHILREEAKKLINESKDEDLNDFLDDI